MMDYVTSLENRVENLNLYLNFSCLQIWLSDVDGSYGENDTGIFFFTPDGKYIEWNGGYLYSDIPFEIDDPVVTYEAATEGADIR